MQFMSGDVNHGAMPAMSMSVIGGGVKRLDVESIVVDGSVKTVPWERRFNPYDFNGGWVVFSFFFLSFFHSSTSLYNVSHISFLSLSLFVNLQNNRLHSR